MASVYLKRLFALAAAGLSLISCETLTVRPDGGTEKLSRPPDYQKSYPFFWGGLAGEAAVPVGKICQGRKALQLQSQITLKDAFFPALIGLSGPAAAVLFSKSLWIVAAVSPLAAMIYSPKTVKVWCERENPAETGGRQSAEAGDA